MLNGLEFLLSSDSAPLQMLAKHFRSEGSAFSDDNIPITYSIDKYIRQDSEAFDLYKFVSNEYFHFSTNEIKLSAKNHQVPDRYQPILEINNRDIFEAKASSSKDSKVVMSIGVHKALYDLFHRLTTNSDFLSHYLLDSEHVKCWRGATCRWLGKEHRWIKSRYSNYQISHSEPISAAEFNNFIHANANGTITLDIGNFPSLFSTQLHSFVFDKLRNQQAELSYKLALTWVLLHEEAHIFRGHLNLLSQRSQIAELNVARVSKSSVTSDALRLVRFAEWDADRIATADVMFLMFSQFFSESLITQKLPGDKVVNLARTILTTILCTCLLFERQKITNQSNPFYPHSRTRMFGVYLAFIDAVERIFKSDAFKETKPEYVSSLIKDCILMSLYDLKIASEIILFEDIDLHEKCEIFYYSHEIGDIFSCIRFHETLRLNSNLDLGIDPRIRSEWFDEASFFMNNDLQFRQQCEPYSILSTIDGRFRNEII